MPFTTLVPAFMISELRRAFEINFLLLLPFLIIDLAVSAVLMAMGMMMLPQTTISLPMKIIFCLGRWLVAGCRIAGPRLSAVSSSHANAIMRLDMARGPSGPKIAPLSRCYRRGCLHKIAINVAV